MHPAAGEKCTIRRIRPLVIGADQFSGMSEIFIANASAPMTADVVQRMNLPVIGSNEDERIGIDLQSEKIAGLRNLATVPGEQPLGSKDLLDIRTVNGVIHIKRLRK